MENLDKIQDVSGEEIEKDIIKKIEIAPEQLEFIKQKIKEIKEITEEDPYFKELSLEEKKECIKHLIEHYYLDKEKKK